VPCRQLGALGSKLHTHEGMVGICEKMVPKTGADQKRLPGNPMAALADITGQWLRSST